jgi:Fe-S-cluster containining protein
VAHSTEELRPTEELRSTDVTHTEFVCDRCSHCCRTHRVPVTGADLKRLTQSSLLEKQPVEEWTEFMGPHQVDIENEPESLALLREGRALLVLRHKKDACVFLDEQLGCTIHPIRPSACRVYPFDRVEPNSKNVLGLHPEFLCPPAAQAELLIEDDENNPCVAQFLEDLQTRDSESSSFAIWLQSWNSEQRSRLRLRRLPLVGSELLRRLAGSSR